jgi:hypothetical protein
MNSLLATKTLAVVVTVTGLVVMFGWFAGIPVLTSIMPQWVTMKFSTAICFVLSGVTLFLIANAVGGNREIAKVVIPIGVVGIVLLMASLLASTFLGVRTGIEDLFVEEEAGAVMTTTPGRPSVGTMIDFILIAVAGMLTMIHPDRYTRVLQMFGWIVATMGGLALVGYIFNVPALYYTWKGLSTAMAIHTAILFVCLGVGLILLTQRKPETSEQPSEIQED